MNRSLIVTLLTIILSSTLSAQPRIVSCDPDTAQRRQSLTVRIVGSQTDFHLPQDSDVLVVTLLRGQRSISASNVEIWSSTELDARFVIPSNAEFGDYHVNVRPSWQNILPLENGFHIIQKTVHIVPDEFPTLGAALEASLPRDTVILREGVYQATLTFADRELTLASEYIIDGNWEHVDSTIIDANWGGNVIRITGGSSAPHVVGLTLRGGRSASGAGVYISGAISPEFRACNITGNSGMASGGGVYITSGSDATFTDCRITSNSSGSLGGAITVNRDSHPRFERCVITGNTTWRSGGVYVQGNSEPLLVNCTIADNTSNDGVGGIVLKGASAIILNSIVWDNALAPVLLDSADASSAVAIAYTDLQGGQEAIRNSFGGEIRWLDGNIDEDPGFDPVRLPTYNLLADSPCRDAAVARFELDEEVLLDLPQGSYEGERPDMGGIEWSLADVPGDHFLLLPITPLLNAPYPNPFNAATTLEYSLPQADRIVICIYDAEGRLVETLKDAHQTAGNYRITWVAGSAPTGVYFGRLEAGEVKLTTKLLLVR